MGDDGHEINCPVIETSCCPFQGKIIEKADNPHRIQDFKALFYRWSAHDRVGKTGSLVDSLA
jgi:hypothetical protein